MADADKHQRKRQKVDGSDAGGGSTATDHVEGVAVETGVVSTSSFENEAGAEEPAEPAEVDAFDQMDEYDQEFGTEVAFVLTRDETPANPGGLARELLEQAKANPAGVRAWIETKAAAIACSCVAPLPGYDPKHPRRTSTCGRQQGFLVAGLSLEDVIERQKSRDALGDNVDYVLARTVRCQLQYEASLAIGAKGKGNQCPRGACFKQLIDMFDGVQMEGVPRDVVLALLRH